MESVEAISHGNVQTGAGALLRAAREAQGLHIAMLAVALKVSVKKLEALEADQYGVFPDTVFVRALASSMCRALKIDSVPVLEALPRSHTPKIKTDESGLNATFNDASSNSSNVLLNHLNRPLGIAFMVVLAGILAIIFFPKTTSFERVAMAPPNGTSQAFPDVRALPVETDANAQPVASSPLPIGVTSSTVPEAMVPPRVDATSQAISLPFNASSPNLLLLPEPVMVRSMEAVLALQARGTSWVEVVDARGVLQLRQTLVKGDIIPVSGTLPLTVVLGRADLVSAVVRGQPLDTTAMTNNNVARFEVK